jgi:hypothetical protein
MVTEKDIYIGLRFKVGNYEYEVISATTIISLSTNSEYTGYTYRDIADYLNKGAWILSEPIIKTYELW